MLPGCEAVRPVLTDHPAFSSHVSRAPGRGRPREAVIVFGPPRHTKLRALISRAFTARVVADLEPRIRELSRQLLDQTLGHGEGTAREVDLVAEFSGPLPMRVIAELLGVPPEDWPRYRR